MNGVRERQVLLTVPPAMARLCQGGKGGSDYFATTDPAGSRLGSGGATANLLLEAWSSTGAGKSFQGWLRESPKLVVHAGGQSRRLPAYAAEGKLFIPIPVFRWSQGQRMDQTLLDIQVPGYEKVLDQSGSHYRLMVASGDVILRFADELPELPKADILCLGMWIRPELARNFGVFFSRRETPDRLAFFLQKPTPATIREQTGEHIYLIDTGMWLFSERAVEVLMQRASRAGQAITYELYAQFGLALGEQPTRPDPDISALTTAIVPLPDAQFHHLGTSRELIASISAMQHLEQDEIKLGLMGARRHPDQYLQNSRFTFPLRHEANHTLWVENSTIPDRWKLTHDHVLTGVPENNWELALEPGTCLDFVPIGEEDWCIRFYGMDDPFSGMVGESSTKWLGRPAPNWFFGRNLSREAAGISDEMDLQAAPLFPVLRPAEISGAFVEWLVSSRPVRHDEFATFYKQVRRVSAEDLSSLANLERLRAQRDGHRAQSLAQMLRNFRWSVFFKLDLAHTASVLARSDLPLPEISLNQAEKIDPMILARDRMFRAEVLRHRDDQGADAEEAKAFERLHEMIVEETRLQPANPTRALLEDQIVSGRSPVRLDLAGGWSDTPPYCLEHGGTVLNMAVDLNGQPPIQVFARLTARPEIVLRSIDLGVEERILNYDQLSRFGDPGSEFALAKAACALAGFHPRFSPRPFASLEDQLRKFGSGLELSMLSAVPKGSGLGTSSILAATLLATLGDACALGWDRNIIFKRTLALEQLVTAGGGWQDQAGGLFRGIKLLETEKGLQQTLTVRWCPEHLFDASQANKSIFLYYTGLTRIAKSILQEIVRGIFLNSPRHLKTIQAIARNARSAFDAIQKSDRPALERAIARSWGLNQQLDSGTNPPEVQNILSSAREDIAAAKLLGAGGGGYLLIFAHDEAAGANLRKTLELRPPNSRARFVDFSVSTTGLQLTRS